MVTTQKLELRRYSVSEIKEILNLDGFNHGQHYAAWSSARWGSIDWELVNEATQLFEKIQAAPGLPGFTELLEFMAKHEFKQAISLVKGSSACSMRVAASIATGAVADSSWLSVATCWDDYQYTLALSQVGSMHSAPWGCVGAEARFLRLGETPELSHQAVDIMRTFS